MNNPVLYLTIILFIMKKRGRINSENIDRNHIRDYVIEEHATTLGNLIRKYRLRLNLSQLELECIIDSPAGTLSRLENNKINPQKETLHKLASALSLSRDEKIRLFGID
jgi:DNA-binding XRE family transcriptional regulator